MDDGNDRIARHARRLHAARKECRPTDLLTDLWPQVSALQARAIAAAALAMSGEEPCGFKLGYTSEAMRRQMNIDRPNFGRLTTVMDFGSGAVGHLIHPRIEPEIALRIGKDVFEPPKDHGALLAIVDAVLPAMEIVDTRYHDYVFRHEDSIADNSSAAGFVLGRPFLPDMLKADGFAVSLAEAGGKPLVGHSSAAMGDPLHALRWLCGELAQAGSALPAGSIVLTGGLTSAPFLVKGSEIKAEFEQLGTVSFAW
ncbi:MAG: 2-keto-4-pentenoate hydratase [Novosphingobium sp.]